MLTVRELQESDIPHIIHYWTAATPEHLLAMGVDSSKVPATELMKSALLNQLSTRIELKAAYCLIGGLDGQPIGHCNTNPTQFGQEAYMHLHLWEGAQRGLGLGSQMVSGALPYFFEKLQLKQLYSQPYKYNPAPHRALERAGFLFDKDYVTIPGSINFEQPVRRWIMTRERFLQIQPKQASK